MPPRSPDSRDRSPIPGQAYQLKWPFIWHRDRYTGFSDRLILPLARPAIAIADVCQVGIGGHFDGLASAVFGFESRDHRPNPARRPRRSDIHFGTFDCDALGLGLAIPAFAFPAGAIVEIRQIPIGRRHHGNTCFINHATDPGCIPTRAHTFRWSHGRCPARQLLHTCRQLPLPLVAFPALAVIFHVRVGRNCTWLTLSKRNPRHDCAQAKHDRCPQHHS